MSVDPQIQVGRACGIEKSDGFGLVNEILCHLQI